ELTFSGKVTATAAAATGFIVGDGQGHWAPAVATVKGKRILLSSPDMTAPQVARYDWADYPNGNLYGTNGLPVAPFTTEYKKP
ncbi:MAG: 9-O-acetylesterase, partial [Bacteroidaceae bacterium]|nr:9-O-acetylesterase [Bacteroidaceae bacterium]